jgi:hypothetical protein
MRRGLAFVAPLFVPISARISSVARLRLRAFSSE